MLFSSQVLFFQSFHSVFGIFKAFTSSVVFHVLSIKYLSPAFLSPNFNSNFFFQFQTFSKSLNNVSTLSSFQKNFLNLYHRFSIVFLTYPDTQVKSLLQIA